MSRFIFTLLMAGFIGIGLTGCVTDDSYNSSFRDDGHHESERDRTFKSRGGGLRYQSDPVSEVMAGGFGS
jgi:hypothetical protein